VNKAIIFERQQDTLFIFTIYFIFFADKVKNCSKVFNMKLQHTIKAVIKPGEQSGYVAECMEIPVVTQGTTLDEVTNNLQEAVQLHLEGEDLTELSLVTNPAIKIYTL